MAAKKRKKKTKKPLRTKKGRYRSKKTAVDPKSPTGFRFRKKPGPKKRKK